MKELILTLRKKPKIGIIIISLFYFFGILGILSPFADWFLSLTAFNLLLSALLLILYTDTIEKNLFIALSACYVIGFLAEFLGVNYGLIFGDYIYYDTLGPLAFGVPLVIGINWFIVTYSIWVAVNQFKLNASFRILLATLSTVLLDILIEPVAMALDFWDWEMNTVPMQNYIGWAFISAIIFGIYFMLQISTKNKLAIPLLIWQVLFFLSLTIFL